MPNPASAEFMELHARKESRVQQLLSSPAELRRTVTCLQPRKAPGHDGIANATLRQLPNRVLVELGRLYNGILRTSHFPEDWKKGRVIVLPKPGKDRRRAASYRPITLLPHIAKLLERLLLRRLRPCIQLRAEQQGFRKGHSTVTQLTRVLHLLAAEYNRGRVSLGVFLDIKKAFDRVWHSGLLYKLHEQTRVPLAMFSSSATQADQSAAPACG
ncbi:unnamed protein product [Parnassius apollo]|uniref:(apollo) hypothetical protein n=1 Tax=Parnassius apollo TaxID=110799 RepID=A0A8S3X4R2_PARAO|nr:unnamed protein product [Parnassius apollo]